jgi:hypothetical protein
MRVGNKKPEMAVNKTVKTGNITSGNNAPHQGGANKTVTGGKGVHGMPLMSAAAAKQKH